MLGDRQWEQSLADTANSIKKDLQGYILLYSR